MNSQELNYLKLFEIVYNDYMMSIMILVSQKLHHYLCIIILHLWTLEGQDAILRVNIQFLLCKFTSTKPTRSSLLQHMVIILLTKLRLITKFKVVKNKKYSDIKSVFFSVTNSRNFTHFFYVILNYYFRFSYCLITCIIQFTPSESSRRRSLITDTIWEVEKVESHHLSRNPDYPLTNIKRDKLGDDEVSWEVCIVPASTQLHNNGQPQLQQSSNSLDVSLSLGKFSICENAFFL